MAAHPASPDLLRLLGEAAWLRRLAGRLARNDSDTEDAVQETWLAALRFGAASDRPARPWLMTVLRNAFVRRRRTDSRRQSRERVATTFAPEASPSAEEAFERLELHRLIAELVSGLEEPYRTAIVLRFFESRAGGEIARQLGVPEGTVRWRISEGLRRLRARLDERLGAGHRWRALALWKGALAMKVGSKSGLALLIVLLLAGAAVMVSIGRPRSDAEREAEGALQRAPGGPARAGIRTSEAALARKASLPPPRFDVQAPPAGRSPSPPDAPARPRPSPAIPLDRRSDFTQEELDALARNCELRADLPGVRTVNDVPMGWLEEKDFAASGLRPDEVPLAREAIRGYREAVDDLGRRWYVEVTGEPEGARGLEFLDFSNPDHPSIQRLGQRLTLRQIGEGARRVAEELAGRRSAGDPPPDDPIVASVAAFYRREYALADQFERTLARTLGPARARELRRGPMVGRTRRAGCP